MSFTLVDAEARRRAREDHGTSFVIAAGAGTGKTTLLVDRIEALVRSGRARLEEIAAVTFTEIAATTMKLRLRERLEAARAEAPGVESERAGRALDVLERAQVSTIHALCAAILQERPLECGVVPGFRVADEAEMDGFFTAAWEEWLTFRLTGGDTDDAVRDALDAGIPLEGFFAWGERTSLRGLARQLIDQRDLEPLVAEAAEDPSLFRDELLAQADRARALLGSVQPGDTLGERLRALVELADAVRGLTGRALVARLGDVPSIQRNYGFQKRWASAEALGAGRAIAVWTEEARRRWAAAGSASLHGRIVRALRGIVDAYETRKRRAGVLDFLDLLLLARNALRGNPAVRAYFRRRFPFLIIDEFQDTDPLQVEIAELLAGDDPGRLVVVGDAKQSIYRFRRAEVSLFRRVVEAPSASRVALHLTQNFRSRPAILRFVNRVFAGLISASAEAEQVDYEPIDPRPGLSDEPSVIALAFDAPFPSEGKDLLEPEARALASFLARAAGGALRVRDPATEEERTSRAGDVMVLSRRLTQMRPLEEALEAVGLRFTVEGGKSFFDRQEVHEVLAVLRAADDASDRVALVAALRSSFLGVSDRDLALYALAGGRLGLEERDEDRPGGAALGPALGLLRDLRARRLRESVTQLLERLYDETAVLAALTGTPRGEGRIANLEKVVTLARQSTELGALTLRGFVGLLAERMEGAREEPDLPATRPGDPHTVRILSIHRAKGLEAPVVALYDTADNHVTRPDTVPLWEEGRIAIGFRAGCQPPGWDVLARKEERKAQAEGRRLLYVACTRARDWLVVPKPPADAQIGTFWKDVVAALPPASDADVRVVDLSGPVEAAPARAADDWRVVSVGEGSDAVAARWEAERAELLGQAGARPYVPISVTRLVEQGAPPPAVRAAGPGGRDFGSLVHRVLQWIDLARPEDAEPTAAALAPAFGLDAEAARRAAAAVRATLGLPVLERARRAARVFRELPVVFPEGDHLAEGIIDLVFEEGGALVVVDYKTDPIAPAQALAQAAHHAPQLQLYGRGLAQATGQHVRERLVVFTAIGQAVGV